ncbi:MAG TPA: DUF4282 domain-containing protein [Acidimicrobiales bacterium]|nr:DUF4282 domain-containing protein [Acidimicrobiales bacterium]
MGDFFKALFDFNFSSFITMKLVKPLYIVFVALVGLGSLFTLLTMLKLGGLGVIMALVFVPLYFLFMVVSVRIWMEALVLLFDINDRVESLSAGQQRPPVNPGALPPL